VNYSSAQPCPGALDFVKFAESQRVEVFYVTSREKPDELQPTFKNLKNLGFPFADTMHLVLKTNMNSKEIRRNILSEKYDILMLVGDNLADFDIAYDTRGEDLGFEAVNRNKEKFGKKFIILPNPMYGPWVDAAIKNKKGASTREKIINALEGF
jgi:5'-nucleotidase (lipoprotein e(P4) family)